MHNAEPTFSLPYHSDRGHVECRPGSREGYCSPFLPTPDDTDSGQ